MLCADCPRCGSHRVTFDVLAQNLVGREHGWASIYEAFSVCRHCHKATTFVIRLHTYEVSETLKGKQIVQFDGSLNDFFAVREYVSLRDTNIQQPPEFLGKELEDAFREGATCFSVGCYNAAAAMFRLCIDLVTRPFLPNPSDTSTPQPNSKQRRDLGLRLQWLFEHNLLNSALKELATCIREDGNDGAHAGNLSKADAEDVLDFTYALLERLITEPKRIEEAEARRKARRNPTTS